MMIHCTSIYLCRRTTFREKTMHRSLIALALLLVAPLISAQVYKWKDANGTVHYSQSPPSTQGTKYKEMKSSGTIDPDTPPPVTAAAASKPDAAPTPATTTLADTPENRSKLCSSLTTNLAALQGSAPVVMQQDGKQTVLDDSARKQQASAAQAQYQQYCGK
jgi:hypothetical protein